MIRVPLGDLKTAFSNPARYVASFKPGSRGGGATRYGTFLHSIGVFHNNNGDLPKAQSYLDSEFTSKNFTQLTDYLDRLDRYAQRWGQLGNTVVRYRDNISVPIPKSYANFRISGQAARVDLVGSGGYGIWMFVRDETDWSDDPKMPLLQFSYARRLDVAMDDLRVGVYDIEAGTYSTRAYSVNEVKAARDGVNNLLAALSSRFKDKG